MADALGQRLFPTPLPEFFHRLRGTSPAQNDQNGDKIRSQQNGQHQRDDADDQIGQQLHQSEDQRMQQKIGRVKRQAVEQSQQQLLSAAGKQVVLLILPQHCPADPLCQRGGQERDHAGHHQRCDILFNISAVHCGQHDDQDVHHHAVGQAEGQVEEATVAQLAIPHGKEYDLRCPA